MDPREFDKTRKILRAVIQLAAATGQESEQVLERVLSEPPPRKDPTRQLRPVLEFSRRTCA